MMRLATWVLALLAALFSGVASAHEVRPAYLELREVAPGVYDVLWKTPARGGMRLGLDVILPEGCQSTIEPRTVLADDAVLARWRESCAGGLAGRTIGVADLDRTLTDALVRFEPLEGPSRTLRLTPSEPMSTLPARQSLMDVARTYGELGFEHILLGFDHLLFVLALLMLVQGVGRLIGAVTAFTLAHSLTLAGVTFGWLTLPSAPVEAAIALSIAFVAAEIIRAKAGRPGLMQRWPWLASFGFGLLHGFGFAGALREIGLPQEAIPLALLTFNLGVEAGQLVFVAAMLALAAVWRMARPLVSGGWTEHAWRAPAYGIGVMASFWWIERTVSMLAPLV
jgi:hypothetical protein